MICEQCGCTDERACFDEETGTVCAWADEDLCTFCAPTRPEDLNAYPPPDREGVSEARWWRGTPSPEEEGD